MVLAIILLIVGFVVLIGGGEFLVRGASRLAGLAGVSPLVIGLTVVSLGTSAPELAVSLKAILSGEPNLAVGNVVGSNIVNVLLVLGASAIVAPLMVASQLIRFDVPLMIGASVLMMVFSLSGNVNFFEGLILTTCLVIYLGWSVVQSRRENEQVRTSLEQGYSQPRRFTVKVLLIQLMFVGLGLVMLTVGSNLLVEGASELARLLGMTPLMIGLTIVAVGTSLPELAASMVACWKGERDIAVGNVVGSNLFNLLGVIGVSALVAPEGIDVAQSAIQFDIPIMVAVAVACLPIFMSGHVINRLEGFVFISYYIAYMTYLILAVTGSGYSDEFRLFVLVIMVPLTIVSITVGLIRSYRKRRKELS